MPPKAKKVKTARKSRWKLLLREFCEGGYMFHNVSRLTKISCSLKHRGSSAKMISWRFITRKPRPHSRKSRDKFLQRFTLLAGAGGLEHLSNAINHAITESHNSFNRSVATSLNTLSLSCHFWTLGTYETLRFFGYSGRVKGSKSGCGLRLQESVFLRAPCVAKIPLPSTVDLKVHIRQSFRHSVYPRHPLYRVRFLHLFNHLFSPL
jgi:hypothetical protein